MNPDQYVPLEQVEERFISHVSRAEWSEDVFVITKNGEEAAVLIGWSTFQQMRSANASSAGEMKGEA